VAVSVKKKVFLQGLSFKKNTAQPTTKTENNFIGTFNYILLNYSANNYKFERIEIASK
jgi:hypothetical protein